MNILLLGGKGYIGSVLSERLINNGYNTQIYDLSWFGDHTNSSYNKKDFNRIEVLELENFDAIVLLAAHSSVKMCIGDYYSSFNNNVRNTLSLVEKIKKTKKNIKLIYASSASVYGNTNGKVEDETLHEFVCYNNYDLTKYIIDQYMLKNNPIPSWYGLRFGTVNGFSPNFRAELIINSMTSSAIKNSQITIMNQNIYRAILGIDDLCRAILRIIDMPNKLSGVYNLSSFSDSVGNIANKISANIQSEIIDKGTTDQAYSFLISTSKFENEFEFKFNEDIESIVSGILGNYHYINYTNRDNGINYE